MHLGGDVAGAFFGLIFLPLQSTQGLLWEGITTFVTLYVRRTHVSVAVCTGLIRPSIHTHPFFHTTSFSLTHTLSLMHTHNHIHAHQRRDLPLPGPEHRGGGRRPH